METLNIIPLQESMLYILVGALLGQEVQCASMIITTVLSSKMADMTCIMQ